MTASRPAARLTVLGSANMDLVVRQPRPPRVGETIFGSGFSTVPGGKGLNQAVAAARAGASVRFAGAVGADPNGTALLALLNTEGIDTTAVQTSDQPTGIALINVLDSGDNSIVVVSGANSTVAALDDAIRAAITAATHLVMQFELPAATLLQAARFARGAGVRTVLTPAPVTDHDPELIALTDYLVLNAGEACELSGLSDVEQAAAALSRRAGTVIVTLGDRGSLLAADGAITARMPARAVRAVDTTAAGDTFVGVLTARIAAGQTITEAMRWATAAAAVSVTRPGATSSMPNLAEISAALS